MQVLLVGNPESLPAGVCELWSANHWIVDTVADFDSADEKTIDGHVDAVVLASPPVPSARLQSFLHSVDARRIAAVVVGADRQQWSNSEDSLIEHASANVTREELTSRLAMIARFQNHLRQVERELDRMQRLGERLHDHFREIDDELRLASRLQRDFLPRNIDQIGRLRFASIFRPASWVSGDMFDIQRIDESHVGFYVVDAVGHGVAAGLLTMYVKRALTTKIIAGEGYRVLDPGQSLQMLNEALCQHALPNCQFVTAAYCVVNLETLVMKFARGGHPYPLLIRPAGMIELDSSGGLMGLFDEFDCPTDQVQLHAGDKVIIYTDGIESAFDHLSADGNSKMTGHMSVLETVSRKDIVDAAIELDDRLNRNNGSLLPADDITVLAMQVTEDDAPLPA